MNPIIEVNNLSKRYKIGKSPASGSFRDLISSTIKSSLSLLKKRAISKNSKNNEIWALNNISFSVMPGEILGIIGKNGAGKSTLLKILSRITLPTYGEAILRGKVASLLEVGTGFHSELTGRENIFLNGAILGMKRQEINKKLNDIIKFAEIEKFLDTPVKHYSSGMYMRLAFAIAAHLEPEILIVDEVLAVGDAQFQKKCLGKMEEVSKKHGRTVLFVSHNINAISRLCNKAIVLHEGKIVFYGKVLDCVEFYNKSLGNNKDFISKGNEYKKAYVKSFKVITEPLNNKFIVEIHANQNLPKLEVGIGIDNELGHRVTTLFSRFYNKSFKVKRGDFRIECEVEKLLLKPGLYYPNIFVGDRIEAYDFVQDYLMFRIEQASDFFPSGIIPDQSQGSILTSQQWYIKNEK